MSEARTASSFPSITPRIVFSIRSVVDWNASGVIVVSAIMRQPSEATGPLRLISWDQLSA